MSITDINNEIFRKGYNLGFFEKKYLSCSDKERNKNVRWLDMNGYKQGWFADPFLLRMDDTNYYVLAEEFVYAKNKGRLVELTINRNKCQLKSVDVILELDTHLSFPIYFQENDQLYVYPENYQSGGVSIYLYDQQEHKLTFVKQIIDEPLLDTQITKLNDKYYAFGVRWETNTQEDTRYLQIFESDSLKGPYNHIQTISNVKREERGAGLIMAEGESIYRPAQCCEGGYGKSIIIYKLKLEGGQFTETEQRRLIPDKSQKYGKVLHTLNILNDVCVIDGYDYYHPILVRIIDYVFGLFGKRRS